MDTRTKRNYLVISGLVAIILIPIFVYYSMSYNSVNGTTVQIASVRRSVTRFCDTCSIVSVTYYVDANVWSYATSIDTRINSPKFSLFVDNYGISSQSGGSATFKPFTSIVYSLTFTTYDSSIAQAIGQRNSDKVDLGMDALMSAGIYQNDVTLSASANPTF